MEQKRMEELISFLTSICYNLYRIMDFGYLSFWDRVVWEGRTINELIFLCVFDISVGVIGILLYQIGSMKKMTGGIESFIQTTFGLSDKALDRQKETILSKILGKFAKPVQNLIKTFGVNRAQEVMAVEQQDGMDPRLFFMEVQERLHLKQVMQISSQDIQEMNNLDTEIIPISAIEIQDSDVELGLLQKLKFWIVPILCFIGCVIVSVMPNLRGV
jgi:hypothetical protein